MTTEVQRQASDLRGWLIIVTIVALIGGFASTIPLMMSVMVFDAGETRDAWLMFTAIWMAPFLLIAGLIVGWVGFLSNSYGATRAGIFLMLTPLVLAALLFVWAVL